MGTGPIVQWGQTGGSLTQTPAVPSLVQAFVSVCGAGVVAGALGTPVCRDGHGERDAQAGNGQGWRRRSAVLPAGLPPPVTADAATRSFTSPEYHQLPPSKH